MTSVILFAQKGLRLGVLGLAVIGLLACGAISTETRLLFYWPSVLALGAAAVLLICSGRWPLRSAPSDLCLTTALLFGGYIAWRAITSPVAWYAREDLFLLLGCAVVYTLSATVFSDERLRMLLLWILVLITLGNLAVGFIHFSGSWTFHIVPSYMRSFGEAHRIGGFYNNANHLAAFLTMMTLLFAGIVMFGRISVFGRLSLVFICLFSATGVALTASRGALLGMLAGGVVLLVLGAILVCRAYPHLLTTLVVGVSVLAVFGGLVLIGVFSQQLNLRFNSGGFDRGDPRIVVWKSALQQHELSPVTGVGSRMFYEGCITYRVPEAPPWMRDAQFVHNEWLQLLTEYGWIGIGLIVLLLLFHFREGWRFTSWYLRERFPRTAMLSSRNLGIVVGSIAALAGVLVHAIFDFHFHVPAVALVAALLFGMLANPGITDMSARPVRVPGTRLLLKLGLFCAGAWMIYGAVVFGEADYYKEIAQKQDVETDLGMAKVAWLGRAIEIDPNNADSWYSRGLTRLEAAGGQPQIISHLMLERAVIDLEQAWKLNPYHVFTALALADVYDALGKTDDALKFIQAGYLLAPLSESPRLSLALHLHRQGRWAEAEEAYLWAGDSSADRTDTWLGLYKQMLSDAVK